MSEYTEHKAIANYIKMQYPKVIFTSDSSGIRLSIGNAKKMLALKAKYKIPDLIILHPNNDYNGLIIEIKEKSKTPYLKNGNLSTNKHIQEQNKTLEILNINGYKAVFGVGFNECKEIIDNYLKTK
ncbi:hypothetical protein [Polaribacter sp. IC073]|uniref:hypothetical protein n=1 Tax=Polaribacter sp. IC073 TaxID=2508540 RepID=UPI0011BE7107|nr:hypothetical protein [Polaribacter sp. IC073]TXD45882.1 hypothetical protein ES045_15775 [Polaribacter sp. IC073]